MDLTRVLESPHALHAASSHLPISLGLLGVPLILLAIVAPKKWPGIRLFTGAYFLVAGLAGLAASMAGNHAASGLVALGSSEIEQVVAQHRLLGYAVAAIGFGTSILFFASHFGPRVAGRYLAGLAGVGGFAVAAAVLFAGSSGGRLVYGYGIGTPVMGADGVSGATPVVGGYVVSAAAIAPAVAPVNDESLNAIYTPKTLPIDSAAAAGVSYMRDIAPLLESRCVECHGGDDAEAGLDLSSHAGILAGGDYAGPAVIPGAPDNSPMVFHIRGIYEPKMPKDGEELAEEELHAIRMWIAAGARGE